MPKSGRCVALALALVTTMPRAWAEEPKPLTPDEWAADLEYLAATVKAAHPRPFHAISEAEFDREVAEAKGKLAKRDAQQNAAALRRIVARVGDGHSGVGVRSDRLPAGGVVPVRIERLADGIFVTAAARDLSALLGARVVRIGSLPADDAWRALREYESGDNDGSRDAGVTRTLTLPDLVYGAGVSSRRDALALRVRGDDGRERDVSVAARDIPVSFDWYYGGRPAPGDDPVALPSTVGASADLAFRNPTLPYWLASGKDGLLYARINTISDSRNAALLDGESKIVTLRQLTAELMKRVDAGGVTKLVLDLRSNGGGNNRLAVPLVEAIASRPAVNRKGALFVVTGRVTYSAAMNLVSLLEDRTEALFVGEPAGGSPHHDGDAMSFTLPGSGLPLRVSTLHWDMGVAPTDVREWIEPELAAPPRLSAMREGRDPALDAIRSWTPAAQLEERMLARYAGDGLAAALNEGRKAMATRVDGMPGAQSLLRFAEGLMHRGASRADVLEAFRFVTEAVPDSVEGWFAFGRVTGFVGDNAGAGRAIARAHALAPDNDVIRRMHEAYSRLAPAAPTYRERERG